MSRRGRGARRRPAPLPVRDGLNPVRLRIPAGPAVSVEQYLSSRFPGDVPRLRAKLADGEVVDELGRAVQGTAPAVPGSLLFLYRDPPTDEPVVPFEIEILHQDDDLVVIDKPHFLATTPRGSHVLDTVVVRLRTSLGLDELSPAHRLDRATAGVLVLTTRRELRGPYQMLFQRREVSKVYEAIAPLRADLEFPVTVRSRIRKERDQIRAVEVPGVPNAETTVDLTAVIGAGAGDSEDRGEYRLIPHTGKTHQLRLHMASLGIGIVGDPFYPHLQEADPEDYSRPLQLLSRSVRFRDPLTGMEREFRSRRRLAASLPPDSSR